MEYQKGKPTMGVAAKHDVWFVCALAQLLHLLAPSKLGRKRPKHEGWNSQS